MVELAAARAEVEAAVAMDVARAAAAELKTLCASSTNSSVSVTPHVSKPHDYVNHMFMRL
jgi:hypothetical protein